MKTASGQFRAVTSICIRNGPSGEVWDYENRTDTELAQTDSYVIPDEMLKDTGINQDFSYQQLNGFGIQITPGNQNKRVCCKVIQGRVHTHVKLMPHSSYCL